MATKVADLYAELSIRGDDFDQKLTRGKESLQQLGKAANDSSEKVRQSAIKSASAYERVRTETEKAGSAARAANTKAADAAERHLIVADRLAEAQRKYGTESKQASDASKRLAESYKDVDRYAKAAERAADQYTVTQRRASTAASEVAQKMREAGSSMDAAIPDGSKIDSFLGKLGKVGSKGAEFNASGSGMGTAFVSGFSDKLGDLSSKSGPIAGSILGVAVLGAAAGAALAAAIQDGMKSELQRDLFQAQTGVTTAQAEKFARAAAESYANVFGESVESNLNTVKVGLDYSFIDSSSTQLEAQKVIETLEGLSTLVGTTADETARGIGGLINSGLVDNFDEAADLITKASQAGLNRQGDLIDSLSEYSTGWKNTGLSAQTALALIDQSMDLGVDNTDRGADAIREFGRRVTEEGDTIVSALNDIGLNGQEMYESFKRGGDDAEDAFDQAFDAIRAIEDPVKRNQAAMALLGDTAGDFIGAFAQWDPSEAKKKFGDVEGAAASAIAVMGDNASSSVEGAFRSIGIAADGLKAALAEAFGPYIENFANNIANNRAGVIQFFIDIANGAFEGGKAVLSFVGDGMRGFAEFAEAGSNVSVALLRSLANMADGLGIVGDALGAIIPGFDGLGDMGGKLDKLADAAEKSGNGVADGLRTGADFIDNTLVPGLDAAQDRFNHFGGDLKLSAEFNDEISKVNGAIASVGVAADGSMLQLQNWTGAIDQANPAQVAMQDNLRGLVGAFEEQNRTGLQAGATVEELTKQYAGNRDALIQQLMATGMSNEAAVKYLNTLGLVPDLVATQIDQPGMPEAHYALDVLKGKVIDVPDAKTIHTEALTQESIDALTALGLKVETLPDGSVRVIADTLEGENVMREFVNRERTAVVNVVTRGQALQESGLPSNFIGPVYQRPQANGGIDVDKYAIGGARLPDQATIKSAQPGLVQWAEPETGGEAFIPLAQTKRSRSKAILGAVAKMFGLNLTATAMADGGIVESITGLGAQQAPGLTVTSTHRPGADDYHGAGQAVDFSNGSGNTPEQLAWANYLADNYRSQLAELIYDDPAFDRQIKDGQFVDRGFYAGAGDHTNHVHVAGRVPLLLPDEGSPAGGSPAGVPAVDERTSKQRNIDAIVAEGKRRGMSDRQIKSAVMATLAESGGENLTYGDRDSVGLFQQRDNGAWGTTEDRMDPTRSAGMYYDALAKLGNTDSMSEAQMAQAVQKSAFADGSNYAAQTNAADKELAESLARGSGANLAASQPSSSSSAGSSGSGVVSVSGVVQTEVTNWPASLTQTDDSGPQPKATLSARLFANGGIEDHSAQIARPGDYRVWGEPETGGESYIPHAPSKRARSLQIWAETGRRLGVPGFADGGMGFGGYAGPDTTDHMKPRNLYDAAALGTGLAFTALSGLSGLVGMAQSGTVDLGNIVPSFDTGSNSIPGLDKAFQELVKPLEEILETLKKGGTIDAKIDVDTNTGGVNASLQRAGIA